MTVQFVDESGRQQTARALLHQKEFLEPGHTFPISYYPGENITIVRAPSLGMQADQYHSLKRMFYVWIIGALCIFPLAFYHRFAKKVPKESRIFTDNAREYRVGTSYTRLFVLGSLYSMVLFFVVFGGTVLIWVFQLVGAHHGFPISESTANKLFYLWVGFIVIAVGSGLLRVLLNDPLVISRLGISLYGDKPIPWSEVSQILFAEPHRDGRMAERLIIALRADAKTPGMRVWQIPLKKLFPVVYLNLYTTRYDKLDTVNAINHFGLNALDPSAAESLASSMSESGLIKRQSTALVDVPDGEAANDALPEDGLPVHKKPKENYYMSGGFHISRR